MSNGSPQEAPSLQTETLESQPPRPRRDPGAALLVLLSFILVALVSGVPATGQALFTDDLYSLTTAEESPARILELCASARQNYFDHPPLYFLLLHQVLLFSNSPLALRLLSLLGTAIAGALLAVEVRRRSGTGAAAGVLLLFLTHPTISFQAAQVRMYALFVLECIVSSLLVVTLFERQNAPRPWGRIVALGIALASALYTVYFSVFYVGLLAVLGIAAFARPSILGLRDREAGSRLLLAIGTAAILYLPWVPVLYKAVTGAGEGGFFHATPGQKLLTLASHVGGTWIGASALILGVIGSLWASPPARQFSLLAVAGFAAAAGALAFLSPSGRGVDARYVIWTIPALLAAGAFGWKAVLDRMPARATGRAVAGALLVLVAAADFQASARRTFLRPSPDWWTVAGILERNARPEEIILTGGFLSGEAVVYHMKNPNNFSFLHYVTALPEFRRHASDPRVVWYVNIAPLPPEFQQIIEAAFPHRQSFPTSIHGTITLAGKRPFS